MDIFGFVSCVVLIGVYILLGYTFDRLGDILKELKKSNKKGKGNE